MPKTGVGTEVFKWKDAKTLLRGSFGAGDPKPYLDPKEPTFLGFRIMISVYKSLKR